MTEADGFLAPTGRRGATQGGRPATLYRAGHEADASHDAPQNPLLLLSRPAPRAASQRSATETRMRVRRGTPRLRGAWQGAGPAVGGAEMHGV